MSPGDDVVVAFGGRDHVGEVIAQSGDWVLCRIVLDLLWDYGSITARLDPVSTVCVRSSAVRHAETGGE